MSLSEDLKLRYARQIAVPEIGKEGQEKLCNAKILIIGCGALGSMIAMQLSGAGIGEIGLADYDTVDISNLQRQFFFKTDEAGISKVELIAKRIEEINPNVKVKKYSHLVTRKIAEEIFPLYDFIIDATDNPESKRMTGIISKEKEKACCIGGVRDFNGQVMTFLPSEPRFEDYFGEVTTDSILPCSLGGVMGPAAVLCATVQASETIKFVTGTGDLLNRKLLVFNLLNNRFQLLNFSLT